MIQVPEGRPSSHAHTSAPRNCPVFGIGCLVAEATRENIFPQALWCDVPAAASASLFQMPPDQGGAGLYEFLLCCGEGVRKVALDTQFRHHPFLDLAFLDLAFLDLAFLDLAFLDLAFLDEYRHDNIRLHHRTPRSRYHACKCCPHQTA